MRPAIRYTQLQRFSCRNLAVACLSVLLAQPTLAAAAETGFEFHGENCIEAHDLGELEAATVSMWLRVGTPPEEELSLLSTHGWDVSALHLLLTAERRILLTVNGNQPGEILSRGRVGKRIGDWVHVAVVLDHRKRLWRIYLDGKLDRTARMDEVVPISLNDFRIGAWDLDPRAFVGWMDEIRIYDRALAAEEVTALKRRRGSKRGLLAWWPLGEWKWAC